jgi:MtN3 and saliva related transmembrane protein
MPVGYCALGWLVYGILMMAWPIIIANSITVLLAGAVLVMKLRFG